MPRPKKLAVDTFTGADAPLEEGSAPSGSPAPRLTWISMAKVAGGFAVLKATTCGHDVLGVEVLAGPMNRGGASAALRVETARQFLVGRGPK